MNKILPSYDLTPSSAFRRPENVTYLWCLFVETASLETKILSISSRRIIELLGASFKALLIPSSSRLLPLKLR
jgi:hypothetical protein